MTLAKDGRIGVPLRWRDLDHQGHVYHATLLTLLDEARTEWFHGSIGVSSADEYVVARIEIDYVAEIVRLDEQIAVDFSVTRVGTTSLTTREVVWTPAGREVARAVVTAVMWDRDARRPRRLSEIERLRAGNYVTPETTEGVHA